MNVMIRASAVVALLVIGTASSVRADTATAQVSYEIYDFYHPTELLSDGSIRVTARNQATGESFTADDRSGNVFTLPVGTPGNAIAYSSGYMNLRDMLIPGALLVVIAWIAFNLTAIYYWPMIGLAIGH